MGSFKNRLLILIVALMALAQGVTIMLALAYLDGAVRTESVRQLAATRVMLDRLLDSRASQLDSAARVLVADFALREAVATGDRQTILSALSNHASRINAGMAVIYDPDGKLMASTMSHQDESSLNLPLPDETSNTIPALYAVMAGQPYEVVFAPLRAPELIGWVALGFRLDRQLAVELGQMAKTEVSFVVRDGTERRELISTLPADLARELMDNLPPVSASNETLVTRLADSEYLTLSAPLAVQNGAVDLIVQRSLDEALTQFRRMRFALLLIAALSLVIAIAVAWRTGRNAVRPLDNLVDAAQRIEAGNYAQDAHAGGGEEFARLAHTFNAMQSGIRERESRILFQASHDALTALPNRIALRDFLGRIADTTPLLSVALLDVKRFRDINASLGHEQGDLVLRTLAERLLQLPSMVQLMVARVGADQFALVMPMHDSQAMHRLLVLAEDLQQGLQVGEVLVSIGLQVGINEWRSPRVAVDDLLRQADVALLEAKERGPAVLTYQASHDAEHRRRIALVGELREAIAGDALTMMYQPLVQMTDRAPASFEALVRWTHPTLGAISPGEFIPLAERASVIGDLTRWVLRATLTQMGQWRKQGFVIDVAVNLSAGDLTQPGLIAYLQNLMREHDVPSTQLLLEVTESAIMHEPQLAAQTMQQMRSLGIRFAIDDFGTGHSSLAQLHALPVDELKIDRAFIMNVDTSSSNVAIVQATTELAHSLGLKVVAEGVETPEVWNALLRLGCDLIQGYYISRPMAAPAAMQWTLAQRATLAQLRDDATQDGTLSDIRTRLPA